MSGVLRLEFVPANEEIHTHHLLQVSGVAFRKNSETLCDFIKNCECEIAYPGSALFVANAKPLLEIVRQHKERIFLLFEVSDLMAHFSKINELAKQDHRIELLFHKPLADDQKLLLEQLAEHKKNLNFIYLESKLASAEFVLKSVPSEFQGQVYFCYLPKVHSFDSLLDPAEVIERIALRKREALETNLEFRLAILSNSDLEFSNPQMRNFYDEPTVGNYLTLLQSKNRLRFYLLKGVQRFGFAAFLGFLMWVLKVLLNPFAYEVREECKGWIARFSGFIRGLFIDLAGDFRRLTVEGYWTARRFKDLRNITIRSFFGQIRMLFVHSYWTLRQAWKVRVAIQNCWGSLRAVSVRTYWTLRGRIQVRMLMIRLYWKVRHFLRVSATNIYWLGRRLVTTTYWRVRHLGFTVVNFIYWRVRHLGFVAFNLLYWKGRHWGHRVFFVGTYPIRKVYWFLSYQYNKRILGKAQRNEFHDL